MSRVSTQPRTCQLRGEIFTPTSNRQKHCIPCGELVRRMRFSWKNMLDRCYNEACKEYGWYGARGITVCAEWDDFDRFLFDMESGYESGLTLDRIDTNGNYEKSNCRWSTMLVQANNRRDNVRIEYLGREQTLTEWAEKLGFSRSSLAHRYYRNWPVERMFSQPERKRRG